VTFRFQQAARSTYPGGAADDIVIIPALTGFHETYAFVVCVCEASVFVPEALSVVGVTGVALLYTALHDVSEGSTFHARAWTVPTSAEHVPQSLGQEPQVSNQSHTLSPQTAGGGPGGVGVGVGVGVMQGIVPMQVPQATE